MLLRTEANPPHTVGEGPGQQAVPLGAAYSVTERSDAEPCAPPVPPGRHTLAGSTRSRGEADLSAAGISFSEPSPLSSPWPPCQGWGTGRERLPAVSQSPALGLLHNGHSVSTSSMHEIRVPGKHVVLGLTWQVPTV